MEDNLDDLITDFLLGKMDPTTHKRFEQRLAKDPELAARVVLERDVAEALNTSSPENQLRATLSQLGNSYPSPESLVAPSAGAKHSKIWIWWALGAALFMLGALVYWQRPAPHPNRELPKTPAQEELQKTQEAAKPAPSTPPQPIASAFKPIPKLESYIGSRSRSGDFKILLEEPKSGATFHGVATPFQFRIAGKVEGPVPTDAAFNLLIFSNIQKDFEALRSIQSQALNIQPDGKFLVKKQLNLAPGLYYLVIEDQQSGEWLLVDKFLIKP